MAADKGSSGDTFTVAGDGEAGDTVTLYDGTTAIGTATVAATSTWSITTANPLAPGAHSLTAHEVDVAGNTSPASSAQGLTVESANPDAVVFVAPAGPVLLVGGAGSDLFYAVGDTTMTGEAGANEFAFSAPGTNTITDFAASKSNEIVFDASSFALGQSNATLAPEALPASLFAANGTGAFTTTAERFVYDTANGKLFYSAAGTTATEQLVVTLAGSPIPTLTASSLFFTNGAAFHFPKTATADFNGDGKSHFVAEHERAGGDLADERGDADERAAGRVEPGTELAGDRVGRLQR